MGNVEPPSTSGGAGEEDVPPIEELQKRSDHHLSDKCKLKAPLKRSVHMVLTISVGIRNIR